MNTYFFAALFAILVVANAGVLVAPSARIIQGPSSRTTVVGPDGSAISSIAPVAGRIVHEESMGVVTGTVSAPALAYSGPAALAPTVAYSSHSLVASAPVVSAYPASPVISAYSAPLVSGVVGHSAVDTVISGPSGTIATGRTVSAPVVSAGSVVSAW